MATCIVSFLDLDLDGVRHAVEVHAEAVSEAAVLGLAAFKKHDLDLHPAGSRPMVEMFILNHSTPHALCRHGDQHLGERQRCHE